MSVRTASETLSEPRPKDVGENVRNALSANYYVIQGHVSDAVARCVSYATRCGLAGLALSKGERWQLKTL